MSKSNGKFIRTVCLSLAVALAATFVLANMPGLNDGPPDMDKKMNLGDSGGIGSSTPAKHYIVALDETAAGDPVVQAAVIREVEAFGGTVYRRFSAVLNGGFAATLPTSALEALQSNPNVALVEPDAIIGSPPSETTPVNDDAATAGESAIADDDCCPYSWGIDRIDQRSLPLNDQANFSGTGAGVSVYVLDTGVYPDHRCFTETAQQLVNFAGGPNVDCNGHGTHVAGTIHQIAPDAEIYGVKVLSCLGSGLNSGVIAGIDFTITHANPPAIVALALGGGKSVMLDDAIGHLVAAGLVPVVAAGNDDANACDYSPSGAPGAFTVAATTNSDARSPYSNWGACVDIFAPGTDITSAWIGTSECATRTLTGTSFAVSHVAGVLALAQGNVSAVLANATPNAVHNPGPGSPNLLLYAP